MRTAIGLLTLAIALLIVERIDGPLGRIAAGMPVWPGAIVLALIAAGLGRKKWPIPLTAVGIVAIAPGPAFNLPDKSENVALRVMTYNIAQTPANLPAVVAEIRAEQPDVVLLQEAGPPGLKGTTPWKTLLPEYTATTKEHVAILSTLPLTDVRFHPGPMKPLNGGSWDALSATVRADGKDVRVMTLHHVPWFWDRAFWRNALVTEGFERALDRDLGDGPQVAGGDFNAQIGGPLRKGRRDAWDETGFGWTRTLVVQRADHLLAKGLRATRYRSGGTASDHRYVLADFQALAPGSENRLQ